MAKYPGISPYDNEKGTLGTAKKRWEKIFVKEIESDTISGMNAEIDYLATTAENSVTAAVQAKNAAESAQTAAETAAETAATAAAGIQSVVETDVDNTLTIPGVAADAKVTGDWLRDIAKPVTLDTALPSTAPAAEFLQYVEDAEHRLLFGIKRDGSVTWQKGIPAHVKEAMTPTIENDEYAYAILDPEERVLFAIKKDGTVDWQKGTPKHVVEACNPAIENEEYLYVIKDPEDRVVFGVKKDGSVTWQKGLPKFLEDRIGSEIIDSEEFVQLTQDADGKLIEGVRGDGLKTFFSPVYFASDMELSSSSANAIEEALKNNGSLFDYIKYKAVIPTHLPGTNSNFRGYDVLYLDGSTDNMSKENKVNLTYRFRGQVGTCTCKWQGQVSVNFPKKNYNIAKLSPQLNVGWGPQKKYTLKGEITDCSFARNIVCARLWGQVVKSRVPAAPSNVLESPNYGAIDGFPVMLVMNGKYQGLYNFNLPKEGLLFGMGYGEHEAVLQAENGTHPSTAFKGTTTTEEVETESSWAVVYVPDEDNIDWAVDSLNRMITAVMDSTGDSYRETLEDYLDIESAIDYYIHTVLLGNRDGVRRNFLMYTFDGIKWAFSAYDMDNAIGSWLYGMNYANPKTFTDFAYCQNASRVFHLVYTYDKIALKARYTELRGEILSEDNIIKTIQDYYQLHSKPVMDEEAKIEPSRGGTMTNNPEQMISWYMQRCKYMDEKINSL